MAYFFCILFSVTVVDIHLQLCIVWSKHGNDHLSAFDMLLRLLIWVSLCNVEFSFQHSKSVKSYSRKWLKVEALHAFFDQCPVLKN